MPDLPATSADSALVDSWRIASRIVIYVLNAAAPEALTLNGATKGRSVGAMFAHIHNVRLMWLQAAAPQLHQTQVKLDPAQAAEPAVLRDALTASAGAIAELLTQGLAAGKIKGFKPHPQAFAAYLIAHENYHLGEIGVALTQSGYPLDKKTAFGMWEWGVR